MILSRQLTTITGGSGDGKTSLIHAGVIPLLLQQDIEVVAAEPGGVDPIAQIAELFFDRVLPNPAFNLALLNKLAKLEDNPTTLADARRICQSLPRGELQRLLASSEEEETTDYVSRPLNLLRGGGLVTWLRDPLVSDDYLKAFMTAGGASSCAWPGADGAIAAVREYLEAQVAEVGSPRSVSSAAELVEAMNVAMKLRLEADEEFELVFVLDQFEEVFVQFGGASTIALSDNRAPKNHREEILKLVSKIRNAQRDASRRWPLKLVLSLRKEHYADLQAAVGDFEGLAASTYHLAPLTIEQAAECLRRSQTHPDKALADSQLRTVIEALSVEQQFVYPTMLSVVGEWLWWNSDPTSLSDAELRASIPTAIDNFVRRALGRNAAGQETWQDLERQEALDLLEQLIVRDGSLERRGSVAVTVLLAAPLRSRALRQSILDKLLARHLVRVEVRLGSKYAEIVHENLIGPLEDIREELANKNRQVPRFPNLLDEIRADAIDRVVVSDALSQDLRGILFANMGRVDFPPAISARTLTRLLLGPDLHRGVAEYQAKGRGSSLSPQAALEDTIRELANACNGDERDDADARTRLKEGRLMSPAEARRSHDAPDFDDDVDRQILILASSLGHLDDGAQERIRDAGKSLRKRLG
jgi:hypothetical protein